jgi:hypothetical protein
MTRSTNVVRLGKSAPPTQYQKSMYGIYELPFFDFEKRNTWAVKSTGDYDADCEIGRAFANEFLRSCDGTAR